MILTMAIVVDFSNTHICGLLRSEHTQLFGLAHSLQSAGGQNDAMGNCLTDVIQLRSTQNFAWSINCRHE